MIKTPFVIHDNGSPAERVFHPLFKAISNLRIYLLYLLIAGQGFRPFFAVAELVFLTGPAGAGIISADLLGLYDCSGLLLLPVELFPLLFGEGLIPLGELIEPVGAGIDHILIEPFFVES